MTEATDQDLLDTIQNLVETVTAMAKLVEINHPGAASVILSEADKAQAVADEYRRNEKQQKESL